MVKVDEKNNTIEISGVLFEGPYNSSDNFPTSVGLFTLVDMEHDGTVTPLKFGIKKNLEKDLADPQYKAQFQPYCLGDLGYAFIEAAPYDIVTLTELVTSLSEEFLCSDTRHRRDPHTQADPILSRPSAPAGNTEKTTSTPKQLPKLDIAGFQFVGPISDLDLIPNQRGYYIVIDSLPCDIFAPVVMDLADDLHAQIHRDLQTGWFDDKIYGELAIAYYTTEALVESRYYEIYEYINDELLPPGK